MSKIVDSSETEGGIDAIENEPNSIKANAALLEQGKNPPKHESIHTQEELQRFRAVLTSHPLFPSLLKQVRIDSTPAVQPCESVNASVATDRTITEVLRLKC